MRYSFFERAVGFLLMLGMGVVILLAVYTFFHQLFDLIMEGQYDLEYTIFQSVFEKVLAAVITLELAHSVQQIAAGKHGLIQVRTVVLIGVLAVVRKMIILDVETATGAYLAGLGVAIIALGGIYALIIWVERSTRDDPEFLSPAPAPGVDRDEDSR